MPQYSINSTIPVISAHISFPRKGCWTIEARIDHPEILSGEVTFSGDGLTLTGTILGDRTGMFNLENKCYIVGGKGKLNDVISPKNYENPTVRDLVRDLMQEGGERLSGGTDNLLLGTQLNKWVRAKDSLGDCLNNVIREVPGSIWRVDWDGTILLKTDTWESITFRDNPTTIKENFYDIKREVHLETIPSNLKPGISVDGKRVSRIEIKIEDNRTRVLLSFETDASGNRSSKGIESVISSITKRNTIYNKRYTATIVSVHEDNTLDLLPDNTDVLPSPTHIKILSTSAGMKTIPRTGGVCIFEFLQADPKLPVVTFFEQDHTKIQTIEMAMNSQFVALGQDLKTLIENTIISTYNSHTHPYLNATTPSNTSVTTSLMNGTVNLSQTVKIG